MTEPVKVWPCDHCSFNEGFGDWKQLLGDDIEVGHMCLPCCEGKLRGMGVHHRIRTRMLDVLAQRRLNGGRQRS